MTITIGQRRYTLVFLPQSKIRHRGAICDGLCDDPHKKRPQIKIASHLRGPYKLEVLIHELLHAAAFRLNESWIEASATHIADVLDEFGYGEGGEHDIAARNIIYRMLRMCHLHVDEGYDGWAEQTADEIFAVLTKLGYGT